MICIVFWSIFTKFTKETASEIYLEANIVYCTRVTRAKLPNNFFSTSSIDAWTLDETHRGRSKSEGSSLRYRMRKECQRSDNEETFSKKEHLLSGRFDVRLCQNPKLLNGKQSSSPHLWLKIEDGQMEQVFLGRIEMGKLWSFVSLFILNINI